MIGLNYIEITGLPIKVETIDQCINPAAAIAQRISDPAAYIELCYVNENGDLHSYIGMERDLIHQASIELKRTGYTSSIVSNITPKQTEYVLIRNIISSTTVIPNSAPKFENNLSPIDNNLFKQRSIFSLLSTLSNGAGFSVIIGKGQPLDIASSTQLKKITQEDEGVAALMLNSSKLYPTIICCFSPDSNQAKMISNELCYIFGGLTTLQIQNRPIDNSLFEYVFQDSKVRKLGRLHFLYTSDEINAITNMNGARCKNGLNYNKDSLFLSEYPCDLPKSELQFGKAFNSPDSVGIPLKTVSQHIFIGGAPGTGKGNLLFSLAYQLYQAKVPFLLIESAKSEMHHLHRVIDSLQVWRPINGEYVLNPFALPDDISLDEYRASLLSMMRVCFKLEGSLEELFLETMRICFSSHGYSGDSKNTDPGTVPFGINEFMKTYRELLQHKGYSDRIESDMKTAGLTRLQALYNENKPVYDSIHSIPINQLTNGFNLIQLNSLTTPESKQLFATILLISLGAWLKLKMRNEDDKDLQFVIMLDESHNLLKGVSNSRGGMFSFSEDFLSLLLEMRSLGIGFIIADQSSNNLPFDMAAACATKVFLGGSRYSGIESFRTELGLDDKSLSNLYLLDKGEGCFYTYGMPVAVTFTSPHIIKKFGVNQPYPVFNDFLRTNPRYTIETFQECKNCLSHNHCSLECKTKATGISETIFSEVGYLLKLYEKSTKTEDKRGLMTKFSNALVTKTLPYNGDILICCITQFVRACKRECRVPIDSNELIKNIFKWRETHGY